jgi:predicted RNA-binding Zn ribbon-like protein
MLDRATRIRWTEDVVGFLNHENDGTWLGGGSEWLTLPPPSEHSRRNAEKELRFVAKELRTRRERARRERWSEKEMAKIIIPASIRHGVGEDDEERWNLPASLSIGIFKYDEHGRVVINPTGYDFPTEVVLALTITELLATDSPVEVKVCQYEKCNKLFVHKLRGNRRPNEYCPGTRHSARQRKLRFIRKKRKAK